jgi:hypothetical protein
MIWIDCNPLAGREMKDVHPLAVLSPRAFNERTGIVIGLHILGHQPKSFDWRAYKPRIHIVCVCSRPFRGPLQFRRRYPTVGVLPRDGLNVGACRRPMTKPRHDAIP